MTPDEYAKEQFERGRNFERGFVLALIEMAIGEYTDQELCSMREAFSNDKVVSVLRELIVEIEAHK